MRSIPVKPLAFSFVEVLVVLGVIGIMSAIMVPYIAQSLDQAKRSRAVHEMDAIRDAGIGLYADTLRVPYQIDCVGNAPINNRDGDQSGAINAFTRILVTNSGGATGSGSTAWAAGGLIQNNASLVLSTVQDLDMHFGISPCTNILRLYDSPGAGLPWKGPYLTPSDRTDPWGFSYVLLAPQTTNFDTPTQILSFSGQRPGYLLSAGNSNGSVESGFSGSDVGISPLDTFVKIIIR